MKKITKIVSLCLIVSLLAAILASCGISQEDVVGTWTGTYTYNGNDFAVAIILNADGTYSKATLKNGSLSSAEVGDYEVKGNKVILYDSSASTYHGKSTTYKYKKGMLENNDHYFVKS